MTPQQAKSELDDLPTQCRQAISEGITAGMATGVVAGFKTLVADKQFCEQFWSSGFKELAKHTSDGASQWIGKRVLTWLITAATVGGLIWLAKNGGIQ